MSTKQETKSKPKQLGILLKCPNTVCGGRIWRYRGSMKVYAVCPDCRGNVRIDANQVTESESETEAEAE